MQANRRTLMLWSAAATFALDLRRQARGQVASALTPPGATTRATAEPPGTTLPRNLMKHPLVDNVVMLAELTVKPGMLDAFLDYTTTNLELSRSSPGNLAFDILIDEAQPGQVIFYEIWESQKAQQDYMAWRVQAGDLTKLLAFLEGPPSFTRLRMIAA